MTICQDPLSDIDLYWIGYFRADGHITKTGQGRFSQSNREPVVAFANYLGLSDNRAIEDRRIAPFFNLPEHERTKYVLTSFKMGREYAKLGVKLGPITDNWACSKHFWRGMIDGDGSIVHNSKGHLYLYLCGSIEDLEAYSIFCKDILNFKPRVYPISSIYSCALGGEKVKYLCKLLYENEYSALDYKRDLAAKAYNLPSSSRGPWAKSRLINQQ